MKQSVFFLLPFFPLFLLALGCHRTPETPAVMIPEVVVDMPTVREVQPYLTATGYTEAYEFVQVPARVSGFLQKIRYAPGDFVKVGDPLFLIEPSQYLAEVKSAEAKLASAKAQLKLAEANLSRTKSLIPSGAATEQDFQTDEARKEVAAAEVMKAEADLATAQLNLSYTDVRSPIPGKVDRNLVDIGNLVGPSTVSSSPETDHTILTTIAGMDPIYVYFELSDSQFNDLRQHAFQRNDPEILQLIRKLEELKKSRNIPLSQEPETSRIEPESTPASPSVSSDKAMEDLNIDFEIGLIKGSEPNSGDYPYRGILDMTGNVIDKTTGQITIRGEIPNSDYSIFPGQICRVRVPIWKIPDAVLVRQEAVGTDLNQRYVYVVDDNNIAHRRLIELGDQQPDGTRVVTEGLKKGERYVVLGIQKARDGMEVKPVDRSVYEKDRPESTGESMGQKSEGSISPEAEHRQENSAGKLPEPESKAAEQAEPSKSATTGAN